MSDSYYQYIDLEWAGIWPWRRCRGHRFSGYGYRGRCELVKDHDGDHAAERGMIWIRFNDDGEIWITTPGSPNQSPT